MSLGFSFHKYHNNYDKNKISLSIRQTAVCPHKNSINENRGTFRYACRKASFTVEAAVVLPFYVCFMVFILYIFRILQVQAGVEQSLQYAGRKMAAEWSAKEAGSEKSMIGSDLSDLDEQNNGAGKTEIAGELGDLLKARLLFQKELKKQNCPVQYITGGMGGISFAQSDFSENYVELKAVYRMKFPIHLLGKIQYQIVQVSKCRKWTGYRPGQDTEQEDSWLYYTEYGTVYHASRSCTHLDLSIHGIPYSQVDQNRNHSGGKYHKCEKCGSNTSNRGMVYITDYGDRYHSSLTCGGLKRSIYMIRKSKATEKRMCKKCGG